MIPLQCGSRTGCHDFTSWRIPDNKYFESFYHPEYFIGQTILHRIKVTGGEILHPVTIIGLYWTGTDWEYEALLPTDHPQFVPEDEITKFLASWNIESI